MTIPTSPPRHRTACILCGCTEARACAGGCGWAWNGLCTACLPRHGEIIAALERGERLADVADHLGLATWRVYAIRRRSGRWQPWGRLSATRQSAVAAMFAADKTNKEIAAALGVSRRTVERYRHAGNLLARRRRVGIERQGQRRLWPIRV
ncbi:MAG: helix-turn-helix domain-containing protein [Planctomycetes bacterium]|nr:helix-turn-helix domain-containing protein [Planctomycetota bacterium]